MNRLAKIALVAGSLVAAFCTDAPAQSPTARRVTLLCDMEDPSCGPLLQKAYDDASANPTVTVCIANGGSGASSLGEYAQLGYRMMMGNSDVSIMRQGVRSTMDNLRKHISATAA
jgi:hypothetical protein